MNINKIKIENLFLIVSILIGMLLIFIVPPFQSPDEDSHFLKSYLISEGKFYPKQYGDKIGYKISKNLNYYIMNKKEMMGDFETKYSYKELYNDQLLSFSYKEKEFKNISTDQTSIVAHIVPAIGIKIASFIGSFNDGKSVGPAVLLQFARFACLFIYSIVGFFAIKITPKFKKSFFAILMLPSSLFLRSMVTYDSLLLVVVALSLAKMLQIYCDKNYNFKKMDMVLFIICGYILLNIKTVYSFVFLLMFFIPSEKFGGKKNKVKYFLIMITVVLFITLVLKIPYLKLNVQVNSLINEQKKFVLSNILIFIKIIILNIINQFKIQSYWMVGTYGLLDTYMPVLIIYIIYFYLFLIIIYDIFSEQIKLPVACSAIYLAFVILSIITIYGSMYLEWTPVVLNKIGGNSIEGVQGRYFLPYLFIIPLIFSNKYICRPRIENNKNSLTLNFNNFCYYGSLINIGIMVFLVIARYWM